MRALHINASSGLVVVALLVLIAVGNTKPTKFHETAQNEHKLLSEFIQIPSISANEQYMGQAIYEWLQQQNWTVIKQKVTPTTFNVFAHHGNPNPMLIINSHMDTVPPFIPFSEDADNIYGRGACDAKGSIVMQLIAVTQMLAEGSLNPQDIGLLYVVEEETTSRGMLAANDLRLTPKYLIVGEPTERKLGAGHKGGVNFNVESFGKEAHSGYPQLGVSAITPLVAFLSSLENQDWPMDSYFGPSTMNIGRINGGVAVNVVPAYANASVYIRASVPASDIVKLVRNLADPYNFKPQFVTQTDPFMCSVVPGFETEVFSYGTDLPSFKGNHNSYLFGPGSILVAHTDGEYVNKAELTNAIADYKRLISAVLAQD